MKKLLILSIFLVFANKSIGQLVNLAPKKKVVEFGWNSPSLLKYLSNKKFYENCPFDGISLRLPSGVGAGNIFMVDDLRKLPSDSFDVVRQVISNSTTSQSLKHNFLAIFGASQIDWFSDEDWAVSEKNLRYAAQIAKALNCKGVLWDAEPYKPGKNPWKYPEQPFVKNHTYAEYYHQVRKRGAQFISALQEEFPGIVILSLREFSDFQNGSPYSEPMLPITNIAETEAKLEKAWWGLHLPFTTGILDKIDKDVTFIDSNEEAYFYTSALEFYKARNTIKDDARALIPAELHHKFASNYTFGNAISEDYTNGNWSEAISFAYRLKGQAKMLTPKDRTRWFEHNAYYAMRTADEYTWLYTEISNWWTGKNVPPGFVDALIRARDKVNNGQELGFKMEKILSDARAKAEKLRPEKKIKN